MRMFNRCLPALFIFFSVPCFSQLDKGWMSLGGTGHFSRGYNYYPMSLSFSPEFYWYKGERVGFGLDHSSQVTHYAYNDSDGVGLYEMSTMPGMRIFMNGSGKAWRPYFFVNAGHTGWIRWIKFRDEIDRWGGNGIRGYAGFGLAWFYSDRAAFDLRLRVIDVSTIDHFAIFSPCTLGMTVFFGAKQEAASTTPDTPVSPTLRGRRSAGCSGGFRLDLDYHEWAFTLSPEMYWFVADNFGVGSDIGLGYASEKSEYFSPTSGTTSRHNRELTFSVVPGMRYFFLAEEKVRPYAFANGGVGVSLSRNMLNANEYTSSVADLVAYAGGGMAWFISEHAALDVRVRGIDVRQDDVLFASTFAIGFQAFFD